MASAPREAESRPGPRAARVLIRPRPPAPDRAPPSRAPLDLHRRLPGYAPTPLRELSQLARELGLGAVLVKDESARLGLPAFKILGASWAAYRTLLERIVHAEPAPEDSGGLEPLRARFAPLAPARLVTATDGNHGRAVARVARLFGLGARVLVPAGTASARIAAIESEGASVGVVEGDYDEAVARASEEAGREAGILVQDTSWPGYEEVPRRVVEGYATLFHEVDDELARRGAAPPDLVVLPIGVGSLAAAGVLHFRRSGRPPVRLVGVEPTDAACALASLEAGRPVTVPGPHRSLAAGLNCGTLASLAWPLLEEGLDACVAVTDARIEEAVRASADHGLVAGESGAAGLAALLELVRGGDPRRVAAVRAALELGPATRVLLLSTEGATDPAGWKRIVGREPR